MILLTGIVYGFGEKLETDPFFLFANWTRKMCFTLERKTYIFPRGIIHGLGKKLASFPSLYFRQKRVKISVSVYFRKKKTPS